MGIEVASFVGDSRWYNLIEKKYLPLDINSINYIFLENTEGFTEPIYIGYEFFYTRLGKLIII